MLGVLRSADLAATALTWWAAFHILAPIIHPGGDYNRATWLTTSVVGLILILPVFSRMGLYEPQRIKGFWREASLIVRGVFLAWCLAYVATNLLTPERVSRAVMAAALPSWMAAALLTRAGGRWLLYAARQRGWNQRHCCIVGTGRLAQTLYHSLKKNRWTGIETQYFVTDHEHTSARPRLCGRDVLGTYQRIADIITERPVDIVFLAISAREHAAMEPLLSALSTHQVDVRVVPDTVSYHLLRHELVQFDNLPVLDITHTPLEGSNAVIKRCMDIVGAMVLLVLLSPMLAILALLVRMGSGPGPILFRQLRTSLGGTTFEMLKFRTMPVNAEAATGPVWASKDDARATPLGKFMRAWSLDELPQFWNVLMGDMSLVGPRPERPELVDRFKTKIPRYMLRHHAKAGITGWAQVNGLRGRTSLRKRVQFDMYYICNWTLGFDVQILFLTILPLGWRGISVRRRPLEADDIFELRPRVPEFVAKPQPASRG